MLTADTRIILRNERYAVQAQRNECILRDGTLLDIRPVVDEAAADRGRFLRALLMPGVACFIFDVRALVPQLDEDLRTCAARDVVGMVFLALRERFQKGLDFHRAVGEHLKATIPMPAALNFVQTTGDREILKPETRDQRFWPVAVGVDLAPGPDVGVEAAWVDGRITGLREIRNAA